jgi:YggT family protein
MNHIIADIFIGFLYTLTFFIIARALLSWLPISFGNPFAVFIRNISDPLIDPIRRVIPRMGVFDLSPAVVILVLFLMITVVNRLRS